MKRATSPKLSQQRGFSLVELMTAAALLAVLLLPALEMLSTVTHTGTETKLHVERYWAMQSRLSELLAIDYADLAANVGAHDAISTVYSDPVDALPRRVVFISHYDGDVSGFGFDPFVESEKDDDLIWIEVGIDSSQERLATLVRR